jgi:hypothetical protein
MLPHAASQQPGSTPAAEGAPPPTRHIRFHSRPTTLVVHSRSHAVRFRILSTHADAMTATPAPLFPVPFLQGHRMCQKAMDCDGDETINRHQR